MYHRKVYPSVVSELAIVCKTPHMESLPVFNDVLIMLSAIGSAFAGIMCGWQLRAARLTKSHQTAVLEVDESAEIDDSQFADSTQELDFLPKVAVKKVLFGDEENDFTAPADPISDFPTSQSKGLTQSEIHKVASRLIDMADRITADVDAHDAQLLEVNSSLRSSHAVPTMDQVMTAVERLVTANELMQSQLRESRDRIVEQAHQIESAETQAHTDALTQINNRRAFDQELADWTGETPGTIAILDVDHFKKFNDEHGHLAGDEVLRSVARVLSAKLSSHCLVARYGGEEFGLVFADSPPYEVLELIEDARQAIAAHTTVFEDKQFHVTCSLGVTRMLANEPVTDWIQRADDGLYLAKDAGRDCAFFIDSLTHGKRENPVRLHFPHPRTTVTTADAEEKIITARDVADDPLRHTSSLAMLLDRLPNRKALAESYREFLQRLGKAPVKLSIITISVSDPETPIEVSGAAERATRFTQLCDVTQAFVRPVDRVGYQSNDTLLVCLPGLEEVDLQERMKQLRDVCSSQLQVDDHCLSIGAASVNIGDSFDTLTDRALQSMK
jgi:diguanylate cyclase (GGDEF)-like protein